MKALSLSVAALWMYLASSLVTVAEDKDLKPLVEGNTGFAVDLYGQLAGENPGKNLFFSPYSMSSALAMTAEGARGETADQMGKVLRFPKDARRSGADAQLLPWNTALIHSGMHALYQRFNPKPVAPEVRAQIAAKRQALVASQQKEEELKKAHTWAEDYLKQLARSKTLVNEVNALLLQVDQYELRVANRLYGEKTYPFQPAFMETIDKFYGTGAAIPVDFIHGVEAVRGQINTWVADTTNQRIKDLIERGGVDDLTRLVLVNAIYFRGEWEMPFEPGATKQEDFLAGADRKVPVAMMVKNGMTGARYGAFHADGSVFPTPRRVSAFKEPDSKVLYPGQGGFLMAELPYKGGELGLVVLVPQDAGGLGAMEKQLTTAKVQDWIGQLEDREVHVQLPKFKLETNYQDMKQTLQAMGMVRAFKNPRDPATGAQFEGMCASSDPNLKLYISKVVHKAFVEVNEKGTEAAAATAVMMAAAECESVAADMPFTPTFRADKPFLFAIRDLKTGTILFLGRMVDPTQ